MVYSAVVVVVSPCAPARISTIYYRSALRAAGGEDGQGARQLEHRLRRPIPFPLHPAALAKDLLSAPAPQPNFLLISPASVSHRRKRFSLLRALLLLTAGDISRARPHLIMRSTATSIRHMFLTVAVYRCVSLVEPNFSFFKRLKSPIHLHSPSLSLSKFRLG